MKKGIRVLVIVNIILFSSFLFLKFRIEGELKRNKLSVEKIWVKIFNIQEQRNKILLEIAKTNQYDTLLYFINKNLDTRKKYYKENSKDYVYLEYLVENACNSINYSSENEKKDLIKVESYNIELNSLTSEYKNLVQHNNLYLYSFPNYYFAKSLKIKPKIHFEINYGQFNENPELTEKQLPKWAEIK
jgi:hypothetical protein